MLIGHENLKPDLLQKIVEEENHGHYKFEEQSKVIKSRENTIFLLCEKDRFLCVASLFSFSII